MVSKRTSGAVGHIWSQRVGYALNRDTASWEAAYWHRQPGPVGLIVGLALRKTQTNRCVPLHGLGGRRAVM